jgi:hypothetical protein
MASALAGEQLTRLVPAARALQLLDPGEVNEAHQTVGRMEPAEAVAHGLVTNRYYSTVDSQLMPPGRPIRFTASR